MECPPPKSSASGEKVYQRSAFCALSPEGPNFIAQGMFAFFFSQVDFMRVVVGESVKNPEMSRPFFENMLTPARDFVTDCIKLWKDKGMLRDDVDPVVATTAFLGIIGYSMVERGLLENPDLTSLDVGALVDSLSAVFLSGILA